MTQLSVECEFPKELTRVLQNKRSDMCLNIPMEQPESPGSPTWLRLPAPWLVSHNLVKEAGMA